MQTANSAKFAMPVYAKKTHPPRINRELKAAAATTTALLGSFATFPAVPAWTAWSMNTVMSAYNAWLIIRAATAPFVLATQIAAAI
jgi:hypothetical protein